MVIVDCHSPHHFFFIFL